MVSKCGCGFRRDWWRLSSAMILLTLSLALHAAGPEEDYVPIYQQIQEADRLTQNQRPADARQKFLEAQTALENLRRRYPAWNPQVVQFRLNYIAKRLASLPQAPPAQAAPAKPTAPPAEAADQAVAEVTALRLRVRQLEAENEAGAARLKEALAARPAAIDPQELANAEARIRAQQKEIEVLRASLEKAQASQSRPAEARAEAAQQSLTEARQELAQQNERLAKLTLERDALQQRLLTLTSQRAGPDAPAVAPTPAGAAVAPGTPSSSAELEALKRQLQTLHQQLADERSRREVLLAEKQVLEERLKEPTARRPRELTKQVRALEKELEAARQSARTDAATISALQTALAAARQERAPQPTGASLATPSPAVAPVILTTPVSGAAAPPTATRAATRSSETPDLARLLADLQARVAVLEARRIPYSPEELALFKVPDLDALGASRSAGDARGSPPLAATATLLAEAERDLSASRFDDAERKYTQVLAQDPKNLNALSSLALAQLQQQRYDEAERTLERALAEAPVDAFNLFLWGRLRYHQGRLDEALTALSQSARQEPKNSETFNFLGVTLSGLGLRDPAETALRRSIQLAPGSASAHHNLAVVYATQVPPATELARWHYLKARAAGHPRNEALENRLETTNAAPRLQ